MRPEESHCVVGTYDLRSADQRPLCLNPEARCLRREAHVERADVVRLVHTVLLLIAAGLLDAQLLSFFNQFPQPAWLERNLADFKTR